jgi:hypothetical protein
MNGGSSIVATSYVHAYFYTVQLKTNAKIHPAFLYMSVVEP